MFTAKFFKEGEFACKCGGKYCNGFPVNNIDDRLLAILDEARADAGAPIIITSGYRCPTHNANIGGAKDSYHTRGMAADVCCAGVSPKNLAALIRAVMVRKGLQGGLQNYDKEGFVHVDTRGQWARWC